MLVSSPTFRLKGLSEQIEAFICRTDSDSSQRVSGDRYRGMDALGPGSRWAICTFRIWSLFWMPSFKTE